MVSQASEPARVRTGSGRRRWSAGSPFSAGTGTVCTSNPAGSVMPGRREGGMVCEPAPKDGHSTPWSPQGPLGESGNDEHDDRAEGNRGDTRTPRTRAGRACQPAPRGLACALHPPQARSARDPRRGGPRPHRGQRRSASPGGRDGVPRRPRDPRDLPRRGRRRGRRARALRARDVPPDHPGERAAPVRAARTQSREHRPARRRSHCTLPFLGSAVRARPRLRTALRDDRRLPQTRADPPLDSVPAPLGRHRVRTGGRPRQQAPLRHALPPHPLLGPPLHGGVHRRGAGAGRSGHGKDRVRRGVPARPCLPLCGEQHQRTARSRRQHVRLAQGLCASQPACRVHAVDPGGCHEPMHRCRNARPGARRGARDALPRAAHQSRRPLSHGRVREHHVHAQRRPDLRHTGGREDGARLRPASRAGSACPCIPWARSLRQSCPTARPGRKVLGRC